MRLLWLSLLVPSLAAGQSNTERVANDRYTRSHDYDLVHQTIEVADFDWDSTTFTGRVTTTLTALRPGLDSIILDAGKLLTIKRVADSAGAVLRFRSRGDTLVVFPRRPIEFGRSATFTIDYRGRIENDRGLTFIKGEGRPHTPQQIWSQGEDMNSHSWFPTYDFPNDKLTWELRATVPAEYTVVSNGRRVSDRPAGAKSHTVVWSQERPASSYLVSIIVAPLLRLADTWQGIPVDYYVYPEDSALGRRVFSFTPDVIDVYSRLTGIKYPWAQYAQTTVADFFGGMENVSATTLVDWLPDARAYQDRPWYGWILIPHELAHQWFGDYVTTENWANMWLNEGFAEYMPGQYWREKLGSRAEDDYYLDEYDQFMHIDARRRMPLAALASNNIYPKGALVLRMLEQTLGRERFWSALHTYLARNALGTATTDDLRQAVLLATGENLSWFWDQWVYQAGYPELTVTATYDSVVHNVTLAIKQTQMDTAHADSTGLRYTTPAVFQMPLTIRVGTKSGDVVQRVVLRNREQNVEITGVTSPPTMVIFDDDNTALKTLTFDQPTAWLATQLQRDPDLWNRNWVIGQLAPRTSDSLAGAALAAATVRGDYFRTRAAAAEGLAGFAARVAGPALEAALRDTSAAVRESALEAYSAVAGDRALAAARSAFRSDSSYQVRGAALAVLIRGDSAGRRAIISEALGTASYQDIIRTTALRGIVEWNDTTFLDRLEQMLGASRNVARVLGTLVTRQATAGENANHAFDILRRHLDDDRAYVRRWVVQAFRQTVRPDLAIDRLRGMHLKYPDTQRTMAALVEELKRKGGE